MNTPKEPNENPELNPAPSECSQTPSSQVENKVLEQVSVHSITPENIAAEPAQQDSNAETLVEDPEHHLAAATSPAEILTSELLKVELVTPTPLPEQPEAPVQNIAEEIVTEAPSPAPQTETQATSIEPELMMSSTPVPQSITPSTDEASSSPSTPPLDQEATVLNASTLEASTTAPEDQPQQQTTIAPEARTPWQALKTIIMHPSVLMVLSAFLFSTMILFVKLASEHYTSFEIISARGLIGAVCILFFQQIKLGFKAGTLSLKTKYLPMQAWRAFIGTMSMMCWFYGVSKLSLALATTLSYMSSIWIAIFIISTAFMTGSTRPSPKLVFSILLGFGGILLILRPTGTGIDMFAAAVVVISSVFGALAYLQVAALGRVGEPAYRTVFYFCFFGIFFGLIATLATQGHFSDFSPIGILWLIFIGLLAMLAQFCLTLAYTGGNALVNASLQYSGLIFVIIFDWVLGIEWPDYFTWLGMALVVTSGLSATFIRSKS